MPFKKGKSGNPGGRPKIRLADGRTLSELAKEHTEDAISVLVSLMAEGQPPSVRLSAAAAVLDRGWGRPTVCSTSDERHGFSLAAKIEAARRRVENFDSSKYESL